MKFANWFRISWWLLLLCIASAAVYHRLPAILAGTSVTFDSVLLGLLAALAVVPIFTEIDLLGVKMKSEIKELKTEVERQMTLLRTEIKADIRNDVSPTFYLNAPPKDNELPHLQEQIRSAVAEMLAAQAPRDTPVPSKATSPTQDLALFALRRDLEVEVRRIWAAAIREGWLSWPVASSRPDFRPVGQMLDKLVEAEMLSSELAKGVREVYAVCSAAIHGQSLSEKQVKFAEETGAIILPALAAIK
jgi:hypothetical protein